MGKYKNTSKNMVVIIIPNVFIGKWYNCLFLDNVNDFKTFLFQVSNSQILFMDTKGFSISANGLINIIVYITGQTRFDRHWIKIFVKVILKLELFKFVNLDNLFLLILYSNILIFKQSKWIRNTIIFCDIRRYIYMRASQNLIFRLFWGILFLLGILTIQIGCAPILKVLLWPRKVMVVSKRKWADSWLSEGCYEKVWTIFLCSMIAYFWWIHEVCLVRLIHFIYFLVVESVAHCCQFSFALDTA